MCAVEKIRSKTFKLPKDKLLQNNKVNKQGVADDDFMQIPEREDDSLPFD